VARLKNLRTSGAVEARLRQRCDWSVFTSLAGVYWCSRSSAHHYELMCMP